MAPSPAIRFIDAALLNSGPLALSYNHEFKRIIREHLIKLLEGFPSLTPSTDTFFHDDGTSVHLLYAGGHLQVSRNTPPIPLTIWLHQCYPYAPPIVFLSPTLANPVLHHHPFIDTSGAATTPYLQTWVYPRSNLVDLTRNLVRVLSQNFPFSTSCCNILFTSSSLASKQQALDCLAGRIHCDIVDMQDQVEQDVEDEMTQQMMLKERANNLSTMVQGLESERISLTRRAVEMAEEVDVLQNWLRVNDQSLTPASSEELSEAFEAADDESKQVLNYAAENRAIDDVLYALDKAMEEGVVPFGAYIKQVRTLAKEQFNCREMLVRLRASNWLN